MGQKKLIRFEEIKSFPNVLQYPQNMAGNWKDFFHNDNAITLELACGKGEYAVNLARMYPSRNFIGVDLKGNRIWVGAKKSLQEGLRNVAFIRSLIDKITDYFSPGEVEEIWITFPDPQLRGSRARKRLTHPKFLRLYRQILKPGGIIHLKTDSPDLFRFTRLVTELYELPVEQASEDLYASPLPAPELGIKTHYESLDIAGSNKIFYLKFRLPHELPPGRDEMLKSLLKADTGND